MIEKLSPVLQQVSDFQITAYESKRIIFDTKAGPTDFVSEIDLRSQEMIVKRIKKEFPGAGILGEEGIQENVFESEYLFIIDPLDGTSNFRSKLDSWAISVGLLKGGKVFEGVIAIPKLGKLFCSSELDEFAAFQYTSADHLYLVGTDRLFEHHIFPFKNLKRRILGATVPTIYYSFQEAFQNRPGFDFALLGTSKLWDIAGIAACLKQRGGSLLSFEGTELLEVDILAEYTRFDKTFSTTMPIIASVNPTIARRVLETIPKYQRQGSVQN